MPGDRPDFGAARDHVVGEVVGFARRLRAEGVAVPANAALPATEALARVGLADRDRVRAATFATLVTDARDRDAFDEHFPTFWYRLRSGLEAMATRDDPAGGPDADAPALDVEGTLPDADPRAAVDDAPAGTGDLSPATGEVRSRRVAETDAEGVDAGADTDDRPGTYSPVGRRERVGDAGGDGVDRATVRRFERALATLSGRRWSRSAAGPAVDARRALRDSLDTGGVVASLPERERDDSAVRTCVLVDVSRSVLDSLDRGFLLSFVDSLVSDGRSVRVFFFDTDIREVTDAFGRRGRDPAAALERAEVDWGGGTHIGASLRTLDERWPHAVDRRTATVVISDGLEVGDLDDLRAGMATLARRSAAVVWLNPLAVSPAYEPTCRGMDAALPYVDGLFAFGGPADVTEVARQLEHRGPGGPVGYRHDFRDREVSA